MKIRDRIYVRVYYPAVVSEAFHTLDILQIYDLHLPHFVHNLAFSLLRHRLYSPAHLLLRDLPPLIERPHDRAVVWGCLAWAAAGAGWRAQYEEAERQVLELSGQVEEVIPAAWIQLAEGARFIMDPARAQRYATRGKEDAAACDDELLAAYSSRLLDDLGEKRDPPREIAPIDSQQLNMLVNRARARLRRSRAGGPNRPPASREIRSEFGPP